MSEEKIVLTNSQILEIIDELLGTCGNLQDALEEIGIDPSKVSAVSYSTIDEHIFRCDNCGWWYESHENNDYDGDSFCNECHED